MGADEAIKLAVIAQQLADLTRRVAALESQFGWIQALLFGNLVAVVVGFIVASRKLDNGRRAA